MKEDSYAEIDVVKETIGINIDISAIFTDIMLDFLDK